MFSTKILKIQGIILVFFLLLTYASTIIIHAFTYSNSWLFSAYPDAVALFLLYAGTITSLGIMVAVFMHHQKFMIWAFGASAIFHFALTIANAYVYHGLGSQMFFLLFVATMAGIRSIYYSLEESHIELDQRFMLHKTDLKQRSTT
jgi:hypothetical protein